MLFQNLPVAAHFSQLLLQSVSSAATHDSAPFKASTLFSNSSMSTIQPIIQAFTQRNSSTTLLTSAFASTSKNGLEFASPQSSTSPNTLSTGSKSTPVQEYSFTYPGYVAGSAIRLSYKDTIEASWIAVPPEHSPNLVIQCWDRNTTTSSTCTSLHPPASILIPPTDQRLKLTDLHHQPIKNVTLATQLDAMTSNFHVPLDAYKAFSPCQLLLQDFNTTDLDGGVGTANSSIIIISDTNSSEGQTWNLNNLAPVVAGAAGTGGATVSLPALGVMGYVTFLGIVVASVSFA